MNLQWSKCLSMYQVMLTLLLKAQQHCSGMPVQQSHEKPENAILSCHVSEASHSLSPLPPSMHQCAALVRYPSVIHETHSRGMLLQLWNNVLARLSHPCILSLAKLAATARMHTWSEIQMDNMLSKQVKMQIQKPTSAENTCYMHRESNGICLA